MNVAFGDAVALPQVHQQAAVHGLLAGPRLGGVEGRAEGDRLARDLIAQ